MTKTKRSNPSIPLTLLHWLFWLVVSLVLHFTVTGVLDKYPKLLSRDDSSMSPTEKLAATTSAKDVEAVVEEVRQHQAERIASQVADLYAAQQELAKLNEQKMTDYRELARDLAKDSQADIAAAQQKAMEAQQRAAAAQKAATAAQEKIGAGDANHPADQTEWRKAQETARKAVTDAQDAASLAQKDVGTAMQRATESLAFTDSSYQEILQSQRAAMDVQTKASELQDAATQKMQDKIEGLENRVRSEETQVAGKEKRVAEAKEKAAAVGEKDATAEAQVADAEAAVNAAQSSMTEAESLEDKKAIAQTKTDLESANRKLTAAKRQAETTKHSVAEAATKVAEAEQSTDVARKQADAAKSALQAARDAAHETQTAAAEAQQTAIQAQAKVVAATQAIAAKGGEVHPADSEAMREAVPAAHPMATPSLEGKSFADLYTAAAEAEKNAAAIYKDLRATETAMLRKTTLDEARRTTDVVTPVREAIDTTLLSKKITDANEARAHSEAMKAALGELESMVSLTRDMVKQAKGATTQTGATVSLAQMKADAANSAALEAEAAQDYGQKTKDLTGLMRAAAGQQKLTGDDATRSALLATLAATIPLLPENALMLGALAQEKKGAGNGGGGGQQGGQMAGGDGPAFPPVRGNTLPAVPGRIVSPGAKASDWMFVDTWHIVGPFPNPNRRNIDEKFPPESVIDLDATYEGKPDRDGKPRTVRWQFHQSPQPAIFPPDDEEYQIYYAYTELWFDEERDLWIAVGSDDYSKLWLNGLLVWKSGEQLKGWNIDEGYRRVHFNRGLNRVLYRVENGWHSTEFSLCICLNDALAKAAK